VNTLARFYVFRALGLTWLYVPFQWFYLRAHGLSATELMTLNTVFCVSAVAFEVPTGAVADRIGRRSALVTGALCSTASCLVFLFFPTEFLGLAAANVLAALAMTSISGADSAYLYDLLGRLGREGEYKSAESRSTAVRLLGGAGGLAIASALVARGGDLSLLYALTACFSSFAAFVGLGLPEPGVPQGQSSSNILSSSLSHGRRAARIVRSNADLLVLVLLSAALFPVLRIGLFLDQPLLLDLGYATATVGAFFAAKDVVAALAAAWTPRLLERLGERKLLVGLPVVSGIALLLMSLATGPAVGLLVFVPVIAFGVFSPLVRVFVNLRVAASGDRATVLSIEGMSRRFGFAIVSPMVGAAVDVWSLAAALRMSAAMAILALALALTLLGLGKPGRALLRAPARSGSLLESQQRAR